VVRAELGVQVPDVGLDGVRGDRQLYYNFEETPAPASAVLPPASYHRLQAIKAAYDPDQVIISAHPVWPTRHRTAHLLALMKRATTPSTPATSKG
jgi:hypothetical protein